MYKLNSNSYSLNILLPVNVDEFTKNLCIVRQEQGKDFDLQTDDFFKKFKLEQDTTAEAITQNWGTILNDQFACLQKCIEIIKDMKKKKEEKWVDPEFGPNDQDKVGASALYFTDNDIPPGAPAPEDVMWLRPEELLDILRDSGAYFEEKSKDGKIQEITYDDKEPIFLEGGASSNDVQQSQYLGNCWFISALSIIAADDNLIDGNFDPDSENVADISDAEAKGMSNGVYPPMFHFLQQYGIYVLRFFKNGGWRYVIVDDRIPCKEGGEIIYGQCKQKNELWVPIIEKAYAKLHNCYQALIAGDIAQGLADMTGMIADRTKFKYNNLSLMPELSEEERQKIKDQQSQDADKLWETLKQAVQNETLMGCSCDGETEGFIEIDGENSGIMSGHAYSLLDVIELDINKNASKNKDKKRNHHRLLRIRNPWGHGEWKFKWSDIADDYKDFTMQYQDLIDKHYEKKREEARKMGKTQNEINDIESIELGVDDGTFLMSFKDWRQVFGNLFQCINFPDEWFGKRIKGEWKEGKNSGVPKKGNMQKYATENPQYVIEINRSRKDKQTTKTYINLSQRDGRMFWGEKFPYERVTTYILLCVFKLDQGENELKEFSKQKMDMGGTSKALILRREVDSDFLDLPNGKYAVIPCAKEKGYIGQFTLNFYFDCEENDVKFNGAFDTDISTLEIIAEEEEALQKVSDAQRSIYKDLASKTLVMQKERQEKYGKKKKK